MKIYSKLLDTSSKFRKPDEVKKAITMSKNYKNEPYSSAKTLNFFKTSKQRSYIVATDEMVYCVVDDAREDVPTVNWAERRDSFAKISINTKPKTENTGLVDFGENHKNWLYSKANFDSEEKLRSEIVKLLSKDVKEG